jgi:hypothetical protein
VEKIEYYANKPACLTHVDHQKKSHVIKNVTIYITDAHHNSAVGGLFGIVVWYRLRRTSAFGGLPPLADLINHIKGQKNV